MLLNIDRSVKNEAGKVKTEGSIWKIIQGDLDDFIFDGEQQNICSER